MNEGLEALNRIEDLLNRLYETDVINDDHLHDINIIEKELKALEIIRKLFDKPLLPYEDLHFDDQDKITEEEYDLLKEVLL